MQWWWIALGAIVPSLAILGLIFKLGRVIQAVETLHVTVGRAVEKLDAVKVGVVELATWRQAQQLVIEDLVTRMRRLEDR